MEGILPARSHAHDAHPLRVEVKFHHSAQPDLLLWRRTFGPRGKDRTNQFQVARDLLRGRFAELNGLPPEAVRQATPNGCRFKWRYWDRIEVEFTVSERPRHPRGRWDVIGLVRWLVGSVVRTVVITGLGLRSHQ